MKINKARGDLSDEELLKVLALLRLVWPKAEKYTFDYLDWLYRKNPMGLAETFNIYKDNKIVAHYATIPYVANLHGVERLGLLSLNTVIHPDFRGRGFFKDLAINTYNEAKKIGANFVFGIANAQSTLLFCRQLKFQIVRPLTVKIGIGKVYQSKQPISMPSFKVKWNNKTLNWRLKRPGARYSFSENNNGAWIWGEIGFYGITTEMAWLHESSELLNALRNFLEPPLSFTINPIKLWIGLNSACNFNPYRYINLPDRYKPSPLNFIFKDLLKEGDQLDSQSAYLSLLDFDAY